MTELADVKWIKITTDIFDDEKMLLIESLPDAYAVITVWFKLLCLAGKQNNSGVFMMSNRIAYTDKMLATIFRMNEATVTMALQTFEQFGMIEVIDGVITIPNWGKHQSLDQLENKKEYMRNYMQEYREKQKAISSGKTNSKTNSKTNVRKADKEEEKDKEKDIDKRIIEGGSTETCEQILKMFNSLCPSLPHVRTLSKTRISKLTSLFDTYSLDDFKELFEIAEASDFLKGENNRNWTATFDWLIDDNNIPKVLEGNYDNLTDEDVFDRMMLERKVAEGMESKKANPPKTAGEDESIQQKVDALKEKLGQI